jgi:pilus assembly protein TadC
MSWLLLAASLLLLPRWPPSNGRHRLGAGPARRPGLPTAASLLTVLALPVVAGHVGLLFAAPVAVAVLFGARRLLARRATKPVDRQGTAFLLDLLAAVLRAGAPVDQAIEAVASSVRDYGGDRLRVAVEPLSVVGRLLRLGTEPQQAWAVLDRLPELAPVAAAGRRCADSGARLAGALADTAEQLRAQHLQAALVRARRAGSWALLPLGLCFLPAFVCLGVVPVVLGVAGQVLHA